MISNNYSIKIERRNYKWIKTGIIKMEQYEVSKLRNASILKSMTKKMDRGKWFIK